MKYGYQLSVAILLACFACNTGYKPTAEAHIPYDSALNYIDGAAFVERQLDGTGVKVGVIDIGFTNADKHVALREIFDRHNIGATKDFVSSERKEFYEPLSEQDEHGTNTLKYLGGRDSLLQYGLATNATFYLARTDDALSESRQEEENFLKALEWLHENGVRLVNVSLGYGFGFDRPEENYFPDDMNGVTSQVSKAATRFITEHNMIIVVSAGNNGDNPWQVINTPADAKDVITVGVTDKMKMKAAVSSKGSEKTVFLKPDIVCFNTELTTSSAAPVITGMIACLLQDRPNMSTAEVKDIIQRSGHLFPFGNNYLGYGVPSASKIVKWNDGETKSVNAVAEKLTARDSVSIQWSGTGNVVLYHKKDQWNVLQEEKLSLPEGVLTVRRPQSIMHSELVIDDKKNFAFHIKDKPMAVVATTVVMNNKVVEISWLE